MGEIRISGGANEAGFQIFDQTNEIRVGVKGYREKTIEKMTRMEDEAIARYFVYLQAHNNHLLIRCLFRLIWKTLWFCLAVLPRHPSSNSTREWHSCEHRLAWLIENEKPLTIKNLAAAPDHNPRCGWGRWQTNHLWPPSQEKLEEALKVGQEYYRKLEQKQNKIKKPEV